MSTTIACLQGIHTGIAYFGGPVWLLNEDDAKNYAVAVMNVARHYDVQVAQKTIDICNLVGMACFIEGTRYMAMVAQRRHAPQPASQRPSGQVFAFSPVSAPPAPQSPGDPSPAPEGALH